MTLSRMPVEDKAGRMLVIEINCNWRKL